jgi:hypothetical protein
LGPIPNPQSPIPIKSGVLNLLKSIFKKFILRINISF